MKFYYPIRIDYPEKSIDSSVVEGNSIHHLIPVSIFMQVFPYLLLFLVNSLNPCVSIVYFYRRKSLGKRDLQTFRLKFINDYCVCFISK